MRIVVHHGKVTHGCDIACVWQPLDISNNVGIESSVVGTIILIIAKAFYQLSHHLYGINFGVPHLLPCRLVVLDRSAGVEDLRRFGSGSAPPPLLPLLSFLPNITVAIIFLCSSNQAE